MGDNVATKLTAAQYKALAPGRKARNKFGAKRTERDGFFFASKAEAARYDELKLLKRASSISALMLQPRYPLVVGGIKIATYVADFAYMDKARQVHVEDVKSSPTRTPVYRLKKKLFEALYPELKIEEIP